MECLLVNEPLIDSECFVFLVHECQVCTSPFHPSTKFPSVRYTFCLTISTMVASSVFHVYCFTFTCSSSSDGRMLDTCALAPWQ